MHVAGENISGATIVDAINEVFDFSADGPMTATTRPVVRVAVAFGARGFVEFAVVYLRSDGDVGGDDGISVHIAGNTIIKTLVIGVTKVHDGIVPADDFGTIYVHNFASVVATDDRFVGFVGAGFADVGVFVLVVVVGAEVHEGDIETAQAFVHETGVGFAVVVHDVGAEDDGIEIVGVDVVDNGKPGVFVVVRVAVFVGKWQAIDIAVVATS